MPRPVVETILPLEALLIPPEKVVAPTRMSVLKAEIVPLLTIPPPALALPKTVTLVTAIPLFAPEMTPVLVMPPPETSEPNDPTVRTRMPYWPCAAILPLLLIAPRKVWAFTKKAG